MGWDFQTDAEYQEKLDWVEQFVREEIEPADRMYAHPLDMKDPVRNALIKPLQAQVRERELWACHLGPDLGGPGYGQLKLALLNERIAPRCRDRLSSAPRPPTLGTPRCSRTSGPRS